MTERPQAPDQETLAKPRRRSWGYLIEMAFPFLFLGCLALPLPRRISWHALILLFLIVEVPLVLIAVRARNRWFHPERVPARWPANYPLQFRLGWLSVWLRFGMLGYFVTVMLIDHQHEALRDTAECAFMTSYLAGILLGLYVKDRSYIKPDAPPTGGWSGTIGRLHSDHWGGRPPAEGRS